MLVASSFMSPLESRNGTNRNSVRMFGSDKLSKPVSGQKWDRVKIVCTQPFCKTATYGLSFIKFHSPSDGKDETEKTPIQKTLGAFKLKSPESDDIKIGSLFSKRNEKPDPPPLKGAAAVRAASKLSDVSRPSSSTAEKREEKKSEPSVSAKPSPSSKRKHDVSSDEEPAPPPVKTPLRKQSSSLSSTISSASKDESAPPLKRTKSEPPKSSPAKAFHQLMEKVVFVLSGFQNPYRGELREKALEMGAKYRPDWGRGCTHLICAFANTPKYNNVNGKGKIVTKQWIIDCYKQKKLLPWRKYRLGDADSPDESSEDEDSFNTPPPKPVKHDSTKKTPVKKASPKKMDEDPYGGDTDSGEDTEDEIRRAKEKVARHEAASSSSSKSPSGAAKAVDPYGGSTDEDEDMPSATVAIQDDDDDADSGLPDLPDFFAEKTFFLYGDFPAAERRLLVRYIAAYDGCLEDYMTDKVKYVITASKWDDNFNEALSENPNLVFVKPKWIFTCNEKNKLMPYQPFIVVPA